MDDSNNPAPELPYYDSTAACNICGGDKGSNLWTPNPRLLERNVPTSLGISVKCGFLFTTGMRGAFLPSQCPGVQDATREACGCALWMSDANGNPASAGSLSTLWIGLVLLNMLTLVVVW